MTDAGEQKRLNLLLVDDHVVVRAGLANMLANQQGLTVVADVGNGGAAVEACRVHTPDVVLLDVMMPGAGGIACLRELKELQPEIKVLMLTSSDTGSDVQAAFASGADGYVTKTVSSAELLTAIRVVARGETYVSEEVGHLLRTHDPSSQLTPREVEVLQLLRKGKSNPEIGTLLGITARTAKAHVAAILVKLAAQDRAEAVARGFECGLLRR